jgi:hypothetical protein
MRNTLVLIFALWIHSLVCGFEVKPVGSGFLRWDVSRGVISVALGTRAAPEYLDPAGVEAATMAALRAWNDIPGQSLRLSYGGSNTSAAVNNSDFANTISWVRNWTYSANTISLTRYSYFLDQPDFIVDADILLNARDYHWSLEEAPAQTHISLKLALMHELGHLQGLSHTSASNAILYPFLLQGKSKRLSPDDKQGARFLYGPAATEFKAFTPIGYAVYEANMAARGLPLPTFRWNPAGQGDHLLEFSSSNTFETKITVNAGPSSFYQMTASLEQRLRRFAPGGRIFWRIRSGNTVTQSRLLILKSQ